MSNPTSNQQLLPCPFCGAPAREQERWSSHYGCSNEKCGALHAGLTAAQWNRRPPAGAASGVIGHDLMRQASVGEMRGAGETSVEPFRPRIDLERLRDMRLAHGHGGPVVEIPGNAVARCCSCGASVKLVRQVYGYNICAACDAATSPLKTSREPAPECPECDYYRSTGLGACKNCGRGLVHCPKCKTELAFEGDKCWECEREASL